MAHSFQVTFDAADPQALGEFWAELLGYIEQPPPPGFDTWDEFMKANDFPAEDADKYYAIVDPDAKGPRVFFQRVPEAKAGKNRVHLDVNYSTTRESAERRRRVDEAVERITALGPRRSPTSTSAKASGRSCGTRRATSSACSRPVQLNRLPSSRRP